MLVDIGGHHSGQLGDILRKSFVLIHNLDGLDAVRYLRPELIEGEVGELHLEVNILGTGAFAYFGGGVILKEGQNTPCWHARGRSPRAARSSCGSSEN